MQREAARLVRRATTRRLRLFGTDITEAPLIRGFIMSLRGKIHGKTGLGGHRIGYRAGVLSLRDIGEKYGVTEGLSGRGPKSLVGYAVAVRRFQKWYAKKKSAYQQKACHYWPTQKGTQLKTEPTLDTKPIRECVPIPRLTHSNPVTNRH